MQFEIDNKLYAIKQSEGLWIEVNPQCFEIGVTGDFSRIGLEEAEKADNLKEKLLFKVVNRAIKNIDKMVLQADCRYKISGFSDGDELCFEPQFFSIGDKALVNQDFTIMFPKVVDFNGEAVLISAKPRDSRLLIKEYKKISLTCDIAIDIPLMLLAYPFRMAYFKNLCKPNVLTKYLINSEYM